MRKNESACWTTRVRTLTGCSHWQERRLASLATTVDVRAGHVLCRNGASDGQYIIIVEGEAMVSVDGADIGLLGPGCGFGPSVCRRRKVRGAPTSRRRLTQRCSSCIAESSGRSSRMSRALPGASNKRRPNVWRAQCRGSLQTVSRCESHLRVRRELAADRLLGWRMQ